MALAALPARGRLRMGKEGASTPIARQIARHGRWQAVSGLPARRLHGIIPSDRGDAEDDRVLHPAGWCHTRPGNDDGRAAEQAGALDSLSLGHRSSGRSDRVAAGPIAAWLASQAA